ncbi:hypothetical protein CASFOL_002968 [Castilleja foliolosa]|uniref:RRM domain-containing protein n=1 Tax=Castilleja foliolosa TaxID=1961234 RepID=A0ABD3EHR7_9LAMI
MAKKRKTRASEAPQEPEPVQQTAPEPEPEIEQPQPDEILAEEASGVGDEVVEEEEEAEEDEDEYEVVEEEDDGEEEEEEGDGEEEQPDNMEGDNKDIAVPTDPEKNKQETEITDKLSENTVSVNGQKQINEEGDDELEEEPIEKLLEPFTKDQLTLLIKETVAKHPDLIESVHKLADADPAHCKIFVHGLGWEANSESITSEFSKYGEIADCKVVMDKVSGKSKGYCFILFKHRNGARRALKQPQKTINGRLASCQLASAGPVQAPAPAAVAAISFPPQSEYTQRKIYVSNVAAELDPNKLLEFFSKFGEIEEGPLGLDKQTGKPRGFCLFVYKSLESAKKALEEPHKNFEGHMLHCQKAVDGPKHTKGHFNQQPQQHQHHHHHNKHQQGYYNHPAKKGKYAGSSGSGHMGGHLMAPSAGPGASAGFNQGVAPAAIGQAVAALLATQGAGLGIGNLLGGMGGVNPQGGMPMMNNAGYGGQVAASGYGVQPGMQLQGGYGVQQQQQMGQGGVRPHQGGAPYMGHGQ